MLKGTVLLIVGFALTACSPLEPMFVPAGTVVESPATIKVALPHDVVLLAAEPAVVRMPITQIGRLEVRESMLLLVLSLDPIARVVRAHARNIEFTAGDDSKTLPVDGFLVDRLGIADFSVHCEAVDQVASTTCGRAVWKQRDDVLELILLQALDLGGTTLMTSSDKVAVH